MHKIKHKVRQIAYSLGGLDVRAEFERMDQPHGRALARRFAHALKRWIPLSFDDVEILLHSLVDEEGSGSISYDDFCDFLEEDDEDTRDGTHRPPLNAYVTGTFRVGARGGGGTARTLMLRARRKFGELDADDGTLEGQSSKGWPTTCGAAHIHGEHLTGSTGRRSSDRAGEGRREPRRLAGFEEFCAWFDAAALRGELPEEAQSGGRRRAPQVLQGPVNAKVGGHTFDAYYSRQGEKYHFAAAASRTSATP